MARFIEKIDHLKHDMVSIRSSDFSAITYRKFGTGPSVVLLHGFPLNGNVWHNIWPYLSVTNTVIVPDIPGTGSSKLDGGDADMNVLAHSIKSILDHEKQDKTVLVGHSMGGYISLAFAELFPANIKGLCLVHSTAVADTDEKKENRRKAIELIKNGGKEQFVRSALPNMFADSFKKEHPEIIEYYIKQSLEVPSESMIFYYKAMAARPDRKGILENISHPVQFILGENDKLIDFSNTLQQSRLTNVSFVSRYCDCAHMSMVETPEKLKFNIREFVSYCYNC
jgi:pimeloyl-ACP methyl ester carboxylesterase